MSAPQPPPNQPQPQQQAGPGPQTPRRHARIVPRGGPGLRPTRRNLRFKGQMPNERVIWIRRKHPIYLLAPAWPVALCLLALALILRFGGTAGGLGPLLVVLVGLLTAAMIVRWVVVNVGDWVFHYYILTDERVISSQGFFRPVRHEVPLKSVVQVLVQRPNPFLIWMNIGDVSARVIGTAVEMPGVWRPRAVGDSILAVQESPGGDGGRPAPQPPPRLQNQKLQETLDKLAEPLPMPVSPHPGRPPFFGLLQRKVPVRLFEGEQVVEVVYRHWFILLRREILPLVVLVSGVVGGNLLERNQGSQAGDLPLYLTLGGIVVGLGWAILVYLNFVDDIFVLTTHRVIDIDRLLYILSEYSNDAPYARVQNIHVEVGFIGNILGYGTIVVETSGRRYPLKMADVPHALRLMDRIFVQINAGRERESVVALNKQKKENQKWLATVLNDVLVAVPDVRGMPVLDAMARAQGAGLKLVVEMERPVPGTPPGQVLEQNPSPGTTEVSEHELRVALSGRAAGAGAP